jgi:thiamine biosynthesis lipoprotein
MLRFDFRAMGCQMLAIAESETPEAREALMQVPGWFAEWEASLSRFRQDSELSGLNRAAGKPTQVSETMWQVMQVALRAAGNSAGLVTPTLLDAVEAAGYDRSFPLLESAVASEPVAIPTAAPDWHSIELAADTRTVRLPAGMHIDFGGVAKGWAADQAAQRLNLIGPALVDAGGDIAISQAQNTGERWPIGIANPFEADADLALLMIAQGGVATSGRDYRRWKRNGHWQHHIIDPRTGAPAETDVLTATVIGPTTADAEVAAKVALILGSHRGLQWIEAQPELAGLLVLEDGRMVRSHRLGEYLVDQIPEFDGRPVLPFRS